MSALVDFEDYFPANIEYRKCIAQNSTYRRKLYTSLVTYRVLYVRDKNILMRYFSACMQPIEKFASSIDMKSV